MKVFALLLSLMLTGCGGDSGTPMPAEPSPQPEPTEPEPEVESDEVWVQTVEWGTGPAQYGDLYRPADPVNEPLPVVVMIHGGCWLAAYDLSLQEGLSVALAERGFAVWNIEYRRLGNGGEWPVMFQDVARAADHVRALADDYPLDTGRVSAVGHSAGGHLALWLAGRHTIATESPLHDSNPLALDGAVSLGGVADLTAGACGGSSQKVVEADSLTSSALAQRLANTSPRQMLPIGVPTRLITGENDGTVAPSISRDYVQAAQNAGDDSEHREIAEAGHFDLIDAAFMDMDALADTLEGFSGD